MGDKTTHILLIEDNVGDIQLLQEHLASQPMPFELDVAENLAAGLRKLEKNACDVLLLDLSLPDSPSPRTLRRAAAKAGDVPIVVLTSLEDEEVGLASVHAGAQDYLVKEKATGPSVARALRYAMERQKIESQLRKARDEMEQRVKERTSQLELALAELHEEYRTRAQLEREVVRVSEAERHRIGRDLHDVLGSKLTGVAFLAKAMERRLAAQERPESADAAAIVALLNEAIAQTRALARGLQQSELRDGDFPTALRGLIQDIEQVFHVRCRLDVRLATPVHDPTQAGHLYYIANEAITNAVKHAAPTSIRVELRQEGDCGLLRILNDGKSLAADYDKGRGMGVQNMAYRARTIGGQLQIGPAPEGGTQVTCSFPLAPTP